MNTTSLIGGSTNYGSKQSNALSTPYQHLFALVANGPLPQKIAVVLGLFK